MDLPKVTLHVLHSREAPLGAAKEGSLGYHGPASLVLEAGGQSQPCWKEGGKLGWGCWGREWRAESSEKTGEKARKQAGGGPALLRGAVSSDSRALHGILLEQFLNHTLHHLLGRTQVSLWDKKPGCISLPHTTPYMSLPVSWNPASSGATPVEVDRAPAPPGFWAHRFHLSHDLFCSFTVSLAGFPLGGQGPGNHIELV